MKKGTGEYTKVEKTVLVCDTCEVELNPIVHIYYSNEWNDGHDYYGDDYQFCSLSCFMHKLREDPEYRLPHNGEDAVLRLPRTEMEFILERLDD